MNTEAFTAILNEGMMVGVKVGQDAPWHGNVIYNVNGTSIRSAYIEKFMKGVAYPGCQVMIKYSNDNFFYYYSGIITDVNPDAPGTITINIETAEEILNNRLFPRYDVRLEGILKPVWDDDAYSCTITDLSYGGAAFVCPHSFEYNEYVELTIKLPSNIVKVTGKIVRRKTAQIADIDHAMQFIECDTANNNLLSEFFSQIEKEVSSIYFNYVSSNNKNR